MIGSLQGVVDELSSVYTIVVVSGVGYKVVIPADLLSRLTLGDSVKLFIHTHVREDTLDLFGFGQRLDLELFEKLISVSGVGPKTAMGIFSAGSRDAIIQAISISDVAFFQQVPRLGSKNAQKIIIELKEKVGAFTNVVLSTEGKKSYTDIAEALKSFGFTTSEVQKALTHVAHEGKTSEEKIKLALKYLGK